jgi:hypothetical protein
MAVVDADSGKVITTPTADNPRPRPKMVPGSFKLLVMAP